MTLTEFLLARIADDEAVAQAASTLSHWDEAASDWTRVPGEPAEWVAGDGYGSGAVERTNGEPREVGIVVYDEGSPNEHEAAHIARHDPARVLAECGALREIVARYEQAERLRQANAEKHAEVSRGGLDDQEQIMALRVHGYELQGRLDGLLHAVTALATIWSDHEDYRPEEWA